MQLCSLYDEGINEQVEDITTSNVNPRKPIVTHHYNNIEAFENPINECKNGQTLCGTINNSTNIITTANGDTHATTRNTCCISLDQTNKLSTRNDNHSSNLQHFANNDNPVLELNLGDRTPIVSSSPTINRNSKINTSFKTRSTCEEYNILISCHTTKKIEYKNQDYNKRDTTPPESRYRTNIRQDSIPTTTSTKPTISDKRIT